MKIEHLRGLIAAPFTPMKTNGSLDLATIPRYYETLTFNQVRGAFICGSTGEGPSLTVAEKQRVVEAWVSAAGPDDNFRIITLLGGTSISECIELARHARDTGVDAVAITAPYYFRPQTVESLAEVCVAVGESVPDLPFYYYHIPVLTGVSFPMIRLLEALHGNLENFAGIKYTHEDFMDFLSCLNFENGRYDMLWGRDECLLSALVLGAKGAVGSTYNYAAPLYLDLIAAFDQGDFVAARKKQQESIDMINLLGKYGGSAAGKAFMKLIGLDCGEYRLPVKNLSATQFESFRRDAENLDFRSYCSRTPSTSRSYS